MLTRSRLLLLALSIGLVAQLYLARIQRSSKDESQTFQLNADLSEFLGSNESYHIASSVNPELIDDPASTTRGVHITTQIGSEAPTQKDRAQQALTEKYKCLICDLTDGRGLARLYFPKRLDGFGATVQNIVCGMALAASVGLIFGGVIGEEHKAHGLELNKVSKDFFGPQIGDFIFAKVRPRFRKVVKTRKELEAAVRTLGRSDNVFLDMDKTWHLVTTADLTPRFLTALYDQAWPQLEPLVEEGFGNAAPVVVLHVRRGDVTKNGKYKGRFVDDEYYFRKVEVIRHVIPHAQVRMYTSLEGQHVATEFDGYKLRNISVHIGGNVMVVWAQMARAHVLITGKSSFSYIPALLNSRCVMFPGKMIGSAYPEWWLNGDDDQRPRYLEDVKRCLTRGLLGNSHSGEQAAA